MILLEVFPRHVATFGIHGHGNNNEYSILGAHLTLRKRHSLKFEI